MRRFAALLLLTTILAACDVTPTPDAGGPVATTRPANTQAPAQSGTRITYRLTTQGATDGSAGSATVTWMHDAGGMQQMSTIERAWERTYTMQRGQSASLSAQNQLDTGGLVCEILRNGQPWKRSESWGPFVVVVCSGLVGFD